MLSRKIVKSFLITAGPTREYLDPVRYVSNASSGLMGYSIARRAVSLGHKVILISGHVDLKPPKNMKFIKVISADDMLIAVKDNLETSDIVIGVAAVADYKPSQYSQSKIKKNRDVITLDLVKNKDIIKYAADHKGKSRVVVGFCLETEALIERAKEKLKKKNLDLIVANSHKAIDSVTSSVYIISKDSKVIEIRDRKYIIAKRIIDEALRISENTKNG